MPRPKYLLKSRERMVIRDPSCRCHGARGRGRPSLHWPLADRTSAGSDGDSRVVPGPDELQRGYARERRDGRAVANTDDPCAVPPDGRSSSARRPVIGTQSTIEDRDLE